MDANERITKAYNEFKGGRYGDASIPDAKAVLDVVSTARTYHWNGVDVVAAYFASGEGPTTETDAIVDRHNLAEVGRRTGQNSVVYYAREEVADVAREESNPRLELPA